MWLAAKQNLQTVLLAPTEILAQQHHANWLKFLGNDPIRSNLLTGSSLNKTPAQVTIGTHALLQSSVHFDNLALVVIDEQHRFGVAQRSVLKKLHQAHLLTMSATPIPRTLALTLYGDLDISVLSELPQGRIKIKTWVVPEIKRAGAYEFIRKEILP